MSLFDELQPLLTPEGLLPAVDGGRDNLVLFTCYAIRELERQGPTKESLTLRGNCQRFLDRCRIVPGLFAREPSAPGVLHWAVGETSLDNQIAQLWLSPSIAREVRDRWKKTGGRFRNSDPAWQGFGKDWLGRFALIGYGAFLDAACGDTPTRLETTLWSASTRVSIRLAKGASDPLIQSLQNDFMQRFAPGAVKAWRARFSLAELYGEFFGGEHPLARAARGAGV